jgi:hypothetical protein
MQIYNSVSFGAKLNCMGEEIKKSAGLLAKYKDYSSRNNEHADTFEMSSKIIEEYHPQNTLNVSVNNRGNQPYYKVVEKENNNKFIYGHHGDDDYEFFIGLARAISLDKLIN